MRIAVVGSRSIKKREPVKRALAKSPWYNPIPYRSAKNWDITLVSGGADGVDSTVEEIAKSETGKVSGEPEGLPIEVIEPDYSDWSGEHPAKRRNTEIVESADVVIAVWDGQSQGTRDSIDKALDRGVPIYVEVVE